MPEIFPLPIAVRVYPTIAEVSEEPRSRKTRKLKLPEAMLVFDCETRVDATQRLTFGIYRFIFGNRVMEEGLFYDDDLPHDDLHVLRDYVARHPADVAPSADRRLRLWSRREFLEKVFYRLAYKSRCLVIGFNLPFDLSRLAFDCAPARGFFAGGFSLTLWTYIKGGREQANNYRPRICVKYIDRKRALIGFTARNSPDDADLIPEGSTSGDPQPGYKFRGNFLDLHTLAFGLTDVNHSLESACEAFEVEHPKVRPEGHGEVTEAYVDYNRRDVLATSELAAKLLQELARHPIAVPATQVQSPASIGKGYLRRMGIEPILSRQPDFPKKYLGYSQSAFFGGRISVQIRKVVCPVVYLDFLSMYSTINSLMNLWAFVIARDIQVDENCKPQIERFLHQLKPDDLFNPEMWPQMAGFVRVVPHGDILPTLSQYGTASNDFQMGLNHLYAQKEDALWFSIPDVVASVLLTGRVPEIIDAFRIKARGKLKVLKPTKLYGEIKIHPAHQDFFKAAIGERIRLSSRRELSEAQKNRLNRILKIIASATSYGIYAQMNRVENEDKVAVTCYGIDPEPYTIKVPRPDVPGEYHFAPLASLITGGARLMLALLEHSVRKLGGSYVMEDTDSMAIVATETGGLVHCPGGPLELRDGRRAVKALSWQQVARLAAKFARLNPYSKKSVKILKIERDNFDPVTRQQRQLYCFAISPKRYAIFLIDDQNEPVLLREGVSSHEDGWSEHGLGHLLSPSGPDGQNHEWIPQAWMNIIRRALGLPTELLPFEDLPALGRVTISSPAIMRALSRLNLGKKFADRLKPFNFLLSCHVAPFGHPVEVDPERFHLIAPFDPSPERWLEMPWVNQYNGKHYRVTTDGVHGGRLLARVKTYGDVLKEFEFHPVAKSGGPDGRGSGKQTVGLLQRRHIRVDQIIGIGKESNKVEEVAQGTVHAAQSVYTEYPDPRRDDWHTKVLPILRRCFPVSVVMRLTQKSRSMAIRTLSGKTTPRRATRERLRRHLRKLGLI